MGRHVELVNKFVQMGQGMLFYGLANQIEYTLELKTKTGANNDLKFEVVGGIFANLTIFFSI